LSFLVVEQIMSEINLSISHLNSYTTLKELFLKKGKRVEYIKKEYFLQQKCLSIIAGWIEYGSFRYTCINETGNERIVCFSFEGELVCDYASFVHQEPALISIQAITDCVVYQLSYNELMGFIGTNAETQRLGRNVAESMFKMAYKRMLQAYCDTPEQRYLTLMQRCPNLKEKVPLKEIASFLGVTPETISHIRRKLLHK